MFLSNKNVTNPHHTTQQHHNFNPRGGSSCGRARRLRSPRRWRGRGRAAPQTSSSPPRSRAVPAFNSADAASLAAAVRGFWPYVCAGSAIRHWRMAQRPTCRGLNAHLPPGGDRGHVRQCTAAMQHRALMTAYRQRLTKIKPNRTSNTPRPTTALPVPPQRRCATSSLHARHERP